MFAINDYVVYRSDVCRVVDIHYNGLKNENYYVLVPIDDDSLKIDLPTSNRNGYLRSLITKDDIFKIIEDIPNISVIVSSDKLIENEYRRLLNTYNHRDLIKIIKTTYSRNKERLDQKKKASDRDNSYFEKAEKRLYTEFSLVLGMDFEETKEFVIDKVRTLI